MADKMGIRNRHSYKQRRNPAVEPEKDIPKGKQPEEKIQHHHGLQAALHDIIVAVTSTLDLHTILDTLLEKIDLLLPYPAAALELLNKESRGLELVACRNLDEAEWKKRELETHALAKAVMEGKRPIVLRNIQVDPQTPDSNSLRKHGSVSTLGVPLMARGQVLGVLAILTREEHPFSDEEIESLTTLAGQASIAIHHSQLYEQTKEQAVELEKANRVKSEFLSVMSHELRTPLNTAVVCTGLLQDGLLGEVNEMQEQALEKIVRSSEELLSMINSILEVTRIEAGVIQVETQMFNLVSFLEELRSDYSVPEPVQADLFHGSMVRPIRGKELAVIWDIPSNLPPMKTDSGRLKHILQNIINNAIKFTKKGRVTVSARYLAPTETVEFQVADTGIGISGDELPIIFERFRQMDSSDKRTYGGMGLGLYITKTFTEMLGGTVAVESAPGKGSVFTVNIPVHLPS